MIEGDADWGAGAVETTVVVERRKKEKGADTQEEEPFLNMDSNREKDCWNSDSNNHGKYQCPKLLEKKQTELAQPGGPRLLNKASPNNAVYAAEDK